MMTDSQDHDEQRDAPGRPADPPPAAYVAAVERLYPGIEQFDGVPPELVVEELDVPLRTARYHLDGLVQQGRLADCWNVQGQPRRVFVPIEDGSETAPEQS